MANDKKNPLSGAFHDPEPPKDAEAAKDVVSAEMKIDISKIKPNGLFSYDKNSPSFKALVEDIRKNGLKTPITVNMLPDGSYEMVDGWRRLSALKELGHKDISAIVFNLPDRLKQKAQMNANATGLEEVADDANDKDIPPKPETEKKPAAPDKAADAPKDKAAPAKPEAEKKAAEPEKAADASKTAAAPTKAKKPAAPDKTADAPKDKAAPTKPEAGKKATEPEKAADADKPAAAPAKAEEVKKPAAPDKAADTTKDKAVPTKPEAEKKAAEPEKAADDGKAAEEKSDALDPKGMQMPMGVAEMDKVTIMPLADIHRFEGHPFKVEDNKDMWDLVESIKQFGVMEPAVVIPRKEGGYEMVSGHRRQRACQLAGLTSMPVIVRNLDRDEATITMVDANLKRENISPMEKARAYEMKLEAMKRKAGRRSKMDILSGEKPMRADEQLAQQVGESRATIQRYTRLTKLEPELQEMVDEKKLPVNTAADISYLKPDEQKKLADAMKREDKVPSGTQAAELKKESQAGKLTAEKIEKTVAPTKREENPELKVTFTNDELRPYFPKKDTTVGDVKRVVFESLTLRQKAMERQQAKAAPDNKKQRSKPDLAVVK